MSSIKSAVSLYSLQDSYARGRLDLAQSLAFVADTGATGVELISDQMIKGAPCPTDETVRQWRTALDASGLAPVCNDIFINSTLFANRVLRPAEQLELLLRDLELSARLGFSLVRLVSNTDADVTLAALPHAERLGITMALEVHAGMSFQSPGTAAWIAAMKAAQSAQLALVVDTGIFCQRHPRVSTNYFLELGLTPAVAEKIDELFAKHGDTRRLFSRPGTDEMSYPTELTSLFRSEIDGEYAFFSTGYEFTDLSVLREYAPYIAHLHGKFFEMHQGHEYSIDYPAVIQALHDIDYDGYIASEYEGNRFVPVGGEVNDQGQVRAHQAMLTSLIAKGK